jgi:hypothetical protein
LKFPGLLQNGISSEFKRAFSIKKTIAITEAGVISKYLVENESACLIEPDDVFSIVNKIIIALNDINADTIGRNGVNVTNQNFI